MLYTVYTVTYQQSRIQDADMVKLGTKKDQLVGMEPMHLILQILCGDGG